LFRFALQWASWTKQSCKCAEVCACRKLTGAGSKSNLKLTVERLKLQKKKRSNLADTEKRSVAELLAKGKDDEARIHVEQIIKEDNVCEAYEVLELFCELLLSRISVMKLSPAPPAELAEAIQTLCFAGTQHQNLKELLVVRSIMVEKYGKPYVAKAVANADGVVNAAVAKKLAVATPPPAAVTKYMLAIAQKYEIDWQPELEPDADGGFPETASTATVRPAPAAKTPSSPAPAKADTIPIPPPDFGEDAFPEPPPELGGSAAKAKTSAKSSASGGDASNFPVMSVGAPSAAERPVKKPPAGAVSVMPAAKAAPAAAAAKAAPKPAAAPVTVEDDDDIDDLAARFAALKR
jgi:hypothetical protein